MSRRLIVRPDAEADLREAFLWYERQRQGLGDEFLDEVDAALGSIHRYPLMYPVIYKEAHRALTHRFPYGVFYLLGPTSIVAIAVFHSSRDPGEWQARVDAPHVQ